MSSQSSSRALRSRWSAIGAAIAVSLGAGGIGIGHATTSSGERPIYVPIAPCRLADTRPQFQVGPKSSPLGPGETYRLSGWGTVGQCTLPSGTTGLSLNVTATNQTLPTFLTLFPGTATLPNASHLNPTPGQPAIPNAVNVDLDAAGEFNVYNLQGFVDVIIDVVGYYDDHAHDDRYPTKTQLAGLEADLAALTSRVGALEQDVDALDAAQPFAVSDYNDVETVFDDDEVVVSVTAGAPVAGHVTVNSATIVEESTAGDGVRCSITTGTTRDDWGDQWWESPGSSGNWAQLAGTRRFEIAARQKATYRLVCAHLGASGSSNLMNTYLTAIFTPAP